MVESLFLVKRFECMNVRQMLSIKLENDFEPKYVE